MIDVSSVSLQPSACLRFISPLLLPSPCPRSHIFAPPSSRSLPIPASPSPITLMSLDHYSIRAFQPSERSSSQTIHLSPWASRASESPSLPSWNTPWIVPGWSSPSSSSSSTYPPASCSVYRHHPSTSIDHPADYPHTPQRPIVPPSQSSLPACLSAPPSPPFARHHSNHPRSINSSFNSSWVAGSGLYSVDTTDTSNSELTPPCTSSAASPSPRPPSSTLSKRESQKSDQDDSVGADCFVMEFSGSASAPTSSLAPPTEVPLRATQASKAMRRMMGVFRLNPFSMHDSSMQSTSTWTGEEAGPLEEEPQMFEFQLHVPGCEESASESDRGASPLPSVGENEVESSTSNADNIAWTDGSQAMSSSHYQTNTSAWFGSDSSHTLPSLRPYSPHHVPHSPSLSSASSRRTPLEMAVSEVSIASSLSRAPNQCSPLSSTQLQATDWLRQEDAQLQWTTSPPYHRWHDAGQVQRISRRTL